MINTKQYIKPPRKIRLDASTVCQLKCPSCPTASGKIRKHLGNGYLTYTNFKRLIDKNKFVAHVELSNWGEIFLNKDLDKIIRYAYKKNVALYADNGVNLNNVREDVLETLVKYKFRSITCSIDGASDDTYPWYRVNGKIDQVIGNIKHINKYKAKYNSVYPLLKWQFVAFGHNEHEISKARKMAADLNMRFYCKLSWEDLYEQGNFEPVRNKELIRKETGFGVADRTEYLERYQDEYVLKDCCLELWHSPQINFDGNVLGCSYNYWDSYGNVFKNGLLDTLNGDKISYAREMLMGKKPAKEGIPCSTCKVYKSYLNNDNWITEEDIQPKLVRHRIFFKIEHKFLGTERYIRYKTIWKNLRIKTRRIYNFQTGECKLNSV